MIVCVDAGGSRVKEGGHSHKKEVPTIVVCVDEAGHLDEPHEEGLQTLVVLLESWAADISLHNNKPGKKKKKKVWDMHRLASALKPCIR